MKILFSSLYPQNIGDRSEDRNLKAFLDYATLTGVEIELLIGSAYQSTVDKLKDIVSNYKVTADIVLCPYVYDETHNERRPHEISFGKKYLAQLARSKDFDYYIFIDADIHFCFEQVLFKIAMIDDIKKFINIPYSIRQNNSTTGVQFGAFVHTRELMDEIDYTDVIYRTQQKDGKLYRIAAPDCEIRGRLLSRGCLEIRATDLTTKHYTTRDQYRLFNKGRCSHHVETNDLPFDPEINSMAMDIESCILLSKFCRENNIVTAIELGTGVGNTTRSLLSGGTIDKLVTIDQSAKYTHYIKRFIHLDFLLPRVEAHTIPVTQFDGYKTYDLSRFSETMFDLAVIDGPESNPKGRLEAAMQLKAKYYIFRDANRDKAFIDEFISRVSPSTVEFLGTKGIVVIILDK